MLMVAVEGLGVYDGKINTTFGGGTGKFRSRSVHARHVGPESAVVPMLIDA